MKFSTKTNYVGLHVKYSIEFSCYVGKNIKTPWRLTLWDGIPCEYSMEFPWNSTEFCGTSVKFPWNSIEFHENFMKYSTLNTMDFPWKISHVKYYVEFHGGIKPGPLFCGIAKISLARSSLHDRVCLSGFTSARRRA